MRYAVILFLAAVSACAHGAGWNVPSNTLAQINAARGVVTCTSRRAVELDGAKYWIETWRRGNFEWSVTNRAYKVKGAYQTNVWQERIAKAQSDLKATREELRARIADLSSATGRTARLEAWITDQRDKALLPTTKAIWQSILDKMHGED